MTCLLEVKNLCFSYGSKQIIKDLSFTLSKGERLLVTGPNGSGKTSLLKLILGILKPTGGSIIRTTGLGIAYCKQDFPNLDFPISAAEVVKMGLYGQRLTNLSQDAQKVICTYLDTIRIYALLIQTGKTITQMVDEGYEKEDINFEAVLKYWHIPIIEDSEYSYSNWDFYVREMFNNVYN